MNEKFDKIKQNLKRYKFPTLYILLFLCFGLIYPNTFLLVLSILIVTVFLIFYYRDNIITMTAIGSNNSGDPEKAERIFKKLVDKNSTHATLYAYYGNMLLLDNRANDALPILEKGMSLKHDTIIDKNLALALSSCHWVLGDIKTAIKYLEDLQQKYDYINDSVLATLGYLYLLDEQVDNARKTTMLALEENPLSASALDNMGQIELHEKNYETAKECFLKALDVNPKLIDSVYYLGVVYEKEEDYQKALEYYNKALECNCSVLNTVNMDMIHESIKRVNDIVNI